MAGEVGVGRCEWPPLAEVAAVCGCGQLCQQPLHWSAGVKPRCERHPLEGGGRCEGEV